MQQEEELAKQLTLYPGKPKPAPGPPAAHVRLNAAAILREDTLYRRKQLQEAQMIKRQAHAEQHHTADIAIIICNWETRVLRCCSWINMLVRSPVSNNTPRRCAGNTQPLQHCLPTMPQTPGSVIKHFLHTTAPPLPPFCFRHPAFAHHM